MYVTFQVWFSNFNFACYGHLYIIVCFKLDILADVFLVSSFCVVPESSYSSNANLPVHPAFVYHGTEWHSMVHPRFLAY